MYILPPFLTTSRHNGECFLNETWHRQSDKGVGKYKGSLTPSRNFMNFGTQIGVEILPTLLKICILLNCQTSHTDINKRNSTKLCDMLGSEPYLQMHASDFRVHNQKFGELNYLFRDGYHFDKICQMTKNRAVFLSTFRKRSAWLRCQRNKVPPHSEWKWNHRS